VSTFKSLARAIVAVVAASSILLAAVGPAVAAAPPQHVTIVSDMVVTGHGGNYGTFTSTGSRLICPSGTVVDTDLVWIENNENGYILTVDKTFTCSDGSGELYFTMLVRGNAGGESFVWADEGGTGRYASRFGLGYGSTVPIDGGARNTYTGYLYH
jgi:hypothetical protein